MRRDGLPMSVTLIAESGGLLAAFTRDPHASSGCALGATGRRLPAIARSAPA